MLLSLSSLQIVDYSCLLSLLVGDYTTLLLLPSLLALVYPSHLPLLVVDYPSFLSLPPPSCLLVVPVDFSSLLSLLVVENRACSC